MTVSNIVPVPGVGYSAAYTRRIVTAPAGPTEFGHTPGPSAPSVAADHRQFSHVARSGQRERSVKPSATPSMVRIHYLPPPAETAR